MKIPAKWESLQATQSWLQFRELIDKTVETLLEQARNESDVTAAYAVVMNALSAATAASPEPAERDTQLTHANSFSVINPATEEVIAECPSATVAEIEAIVATAKQAFKTWRLTKREYRYKLIHQMGDAILEHSDELAELITLEQGKPLKNAREHEVHTSAAWCRAITEFSLPSTVLEDTAEFRSVLHHRPLGVVVGITPWNYPLNTAVWKILPAIATGNTVILKPSPYTPLATLRLGEIIRTIFPPGVVNIITGGNDVGQRLAEHPDVNKITVTGSMATGKRVMASAATSNLKRVTLELGGNDPAIVMDDVDIAAIVPSLFWYAFLNSGQVCIAIKRLYVHEAIYDELCRALVDYAKTVTLGNGMDDGVMLGPLQNSMQYQRVIGFIDSVRRDGGRFLCGGDIPDQKGYFVPVTLATDLNDDAYLVTEETFGPVLPILKFSDVCDVIERANNSRYGLGASVWSKDIAKARQIAEQIEAGNVWINHHLAKKPDAPFGGVKESGIGVENTELGLAQFTDIQVVRHPRN